MTKALALAVASLAVLVFAVEPSVRELTPAELQSTVGQQCFNSSKCQDNDTCKAYNDAFGITQDCPNPQYGYCKHCQYDTRIFRSCHGGFAGFRCVTQGSTDCGCLMIGLCDGDVCNDLGCGTQGEQCLDPGDCVTESGSC
jgi:hypothetical protein